MGRHSRDDDPVSGLSDRASRAVSGPGRLGPPTPLRYGPRGRTRTPAPEAEPGFSAFGQAEVGFSFGGPAPRENETSFPDPGFGPRSFGDGGHAEPASFAAARDTGYAARPGLTPYPAAEGRRGAGDVAFGTNDPSPPRPPAQPLPPGGSGAYPALQPRPDQRVTDAIRRRDPEPPADQRTTTGLPRPQQESTGYPGHGTGGHQVISGTGSHPATPSAGSGGYPAVRENGSDAGEGEGGRSGSYRAVGDDAASTGSRRALRDTGTSTGSHRPVREPGTSTGSRRAVREGRGTGTGSHRVVSEGRSTSTGSRRAVTDGRGTATGSHRAVSSDGPSTASGTHRAMGPAVKRRKIATWPIFTGVFIVLVVAGLLGWGWADNVLSSRAEAQANACTDGDSNITVVVTPSLQQPVTAAADRWNQAKTVVHAHCVHVDVRAVPSQQVLDALTGKADMATLGGLPAAWVPENSFFVSQLQNAKPGMIGAPAESVASTAGEDYPFVGLAGTTVDEVQARAAQVFRDFLREPAQAADFQKAGLAGG